MPAADKKYSQTGRPWQSLLAWALRLHGLSWPHSLTWAGVEGPVPSGVWARLPEVPGSPAGPVHPLLLGKHWAPSAPQAVWLELLGVAREGTQGP